MHKDINKSIYIYIVYTYELVLDILTRRGENEKDRERGTLEIVAVAAPCGTTRHIIDVLYMYKV